MASRVTIPGLARMKSEGRRIAMLTAYDYPMACLLDESGVEIILVGDSLGMVVLGYDTTAQVTMEEMLHHAKAVRRGVTRALLVGDMPFLSFHGSTAEAVKNAGRFIQEAGCDAVKIEWKSGIEDVVHAIVAAGIPVMGHVGLTPQTAHLEGGFRLRGKDAASAVRIIAQAVALQEVGCFAVVLECIPDVVAQEITRRLAIPAIGIGAGPSCDGQVLVVSDLLGIFERFKPKFAKRYADFAGLARQAVASYVQEVRSGVFPGNEQTFTMDPAEFAKLKAEFGSAA